MKIHTALVTETITRQMWVEFPEDELLGPDGVDSLEGYALDLATEMGCWEVTQHDRTAEVHRTVEAPPA
jgi:hypothetical protein